MKTDVHTICVELKSIGKPEKFKGQIFKKMIFRNISDEDKTDYILYLMDTHPSSKRFLSLRPGIKLKNMQVYKEKGKHYVNVHSDFQPMRAQPLF